MTFSGWSASASLTLLCEPLLTLLFDDFEGIGRACQAEFFTPRTLRNVYSNVYSTQKYAYMSSHCDIYADRSFVLLVC